MHKVEDRLPDPGEAVLVLEGCTEFHVAEYKSKGSLYLWQPQTGDGYDAEDITHWAYLPSLDFIEA